MAAVVRPGTVTVDPVAWAKAFLKAIGAPVTSQNVGTVIAWGTAESGPASGPGNPYGGWANFNPLNVVVQPGDLHTGMGGQQGNIANFGSMQAGVAASARLFLNNPAAKNIIGALRANAPKKAVNVAVDEFYRTWGGHIDFSGITGSITSGVANAVGTYGPDAATTAGNIVKAVTAPAQLAGKFLSLFTDWRYVLEVFLGGVMILLGALVIAHDIGATKNAASAATVAALA